MSDILFNCINSKNDLQIDGRGRFVFRQPQRPGRTLLTTSGQSPSFIFPAATVFATNTPRSLADSCMIAWRIMSLVSIKSMNARTESYFFFFYSFLHALIVRERSFQTGSHFSTFYPPKKVVSLHSHCDTRCTSKISDIFLRFLAKISEVDKREEKREIIPKQYCLLELVWWTGLWLWSAYELQVRTHIQTKRSTRSRGIRRGCWWYSQTEETVAVDAPI